VGRQEIKEMAKSFLLRGREVASEPYHYTQCGLDDVYLLNGFIRRETPYGSGVAVEKADELHEAIGRSLCLDKARLNGKEFRFLRKLMDLTQAELSQLFGCDVQAVARWEKGRAALHGAADRLIRVLYLASRDMDVSASDLLKSVAELDESEDDRQVFEETADGWKSAA
jgi:DNA-binding transcriptional regulator YiaG